MTPRAFCGVSVFQHTAARRRLGKSVEDLARVYEVSTHSRPKAAGLRQASQCRSRHVSTHSRPKAAGLSLRNGKLLSLRFNTQPPEGGWAKKIEFTSVKLCFNTQPPEGGWSCWYEEAVSGTKFQHTAARRRLGRKRPKTKGNTMFQHTAARRRLGRYKHRWITYQTFQHTAARRRLACRFGTAMPKTAVSTHSRPKAAGVDTNVVPFMRSKVSTHSRPKAAGFVGIAPYCVMIVSTHSRPKAAGP